VEVQDQYGNSFSAGVKVYFNITTIGLNNDSILDPGSSQNIIVTTNTTGRTQAELTLDTKAGLNLVTAEIGGGSITSVLFTETGLPAAPYNLIKISGDGQTGIVGTRIDNDFIVEVQDKYDNFVGSGISVWFNITSGGGRVTVKNPIQTNFNSRAQCQFILGTIAGENKITVGINALGVNQIEFIATGEPDVLANIEFNPIVSELIAGSSNGFNIVGKDKYGNEVNLSNTIWNTDGGNLSDETSSSIKLTALTTVASNRFLRATVGSISKSTTFDIVPDELSKITISPSSVDIQVGTSKVFHAVGSDQYGNKVLLENTDWNTNVGSISDETAQSTNFLAQIYPQNNGYIKATVGSIFGLGIINVTSISRVPRISMTIPNIELAEDAPPFMLDLTPFELDFEDFGTELDWYFTNKNSTLYILSGEFSDDDLITIIPLPDRYGNNLVTAWLKDSDDQKTKQELWINITPVNDPPSILKVPDLILHYDDPYTFDYTSYIYDIDNPINDLTLAAWELNLEESYLQVLGFKVTYNYPEMYNGETIYVTLELSDGVGIAQKTIQIRVTDDYVPELKLNLPDVVLYEGEIKYNVFDLDDYFDDPDGDSLYYSYGETKVQVTINDDHSVDIASATDWTGTETITYRAIDPIGALAEDTIIVTVIPLNDPPHIAGVPDLVVHFNVDYIFDLTPYITDPDNSPAELSIILTDPHVRVADWDNLKIILNYPEKMNGTEIKLSLGVFDGIDSAADEIDVKITSNWPPELRRELPDVSFSEDVQKLNAFDLDDHFFDKDSDSIYYSYGQKKISVMINDDGSVDFYAPENWFGVENITFRATDNTEALIEDTITVTVIPVNDLPTISKLPKLTGTTRELMRFDLRDYVSDVDNIIEELTINVLSENLDITITGLDLLIYSKTPINETITIIVSDGGSETLETMVIDIIDEKSEPNTTSDGFIMSILWLLILVIIIIVILTGYAGFRRYIGNYNIEDVFWIREDGILISHVNYQNKKHMADEDILSGMLTAILDFSEDAFTEKETDETKYMIKQIQMGGKNILVYRGNYTFLATVFKGTSGKRLYSQSEQVIKTLEKKYENNLKSWCGDLDTIIDAKMVIRSKMSLETYGKIKSN